MLISTVSATSLLVPSVAATNASLMSSVSAAASVTSSALHLAVKDEEQSQQQPLLLSATNQNSGVDGNSSGTQTTNLITVADFTQQHKSPAPPAVILPLRTLSPPLHHHHHHSSTSLVRSESNHGVFDSPPSPLLLGSASGSHPREGQTAAAASLLGNNKYLLLEELEGSSLQRCLHIPTRQEFVCKVMNRDSAGHSLLAAHYRVDGHPNINTIQEVVVGEERLYLIFPPSSGGDLHSYVRARRRLREGVARQLFRQVVAAVHEVHMKGIVLRDLKLRKFVFTDDSRSELKLESLEDAVVLDSLEEDILSDKHGCPAYVSPEILKSNTQYSGRAADMWGLGVMLYTMLVGRYPFHGAEHSGLFAKIRKGQFSLPESLSSRAKCLIRCLLRKEPADRLTTEDVLVHPWLTQRDSATPTSRSSAAATSSRSRAGNGQSAVEIADHVVPEYRPPPPPVSATTVAAPTVGVSNSSTGSGSGSATAAVDQATAFHMVFRPASSNSEHQPQPQPAHQNRQQFIHTRNIF